jgi:hypothetical protein
MKTYWLSAFLIIVGNIWSPVAVSSPDHKSDPHYLAVGFFDLHVCNWPERRPFFLAVFSSYQYDRVRRVTVNAPDGKVVGEIDLTKFRIVDKKGKPRKKVFLTEMALPEPAADGWYRAVIEMDDGSRHVARDLVEIAIMERAQQRVPPHKSANIDLPREFRWAPVPGARFYRVFIRDLWDDERVIHSSKVLTESRYPVPPNLLKAGGYYSWKVHARDVNEDTERGDFNHGSLTDYIEFSVKP